MPRRSRDKLWSGHALQRYHERRMGGPSCPPSLAYIKGSGIQIPARLARHNTKRPGGRPRAALRRHWRRCRHYATAGAWYVLSGKTVVTVLPYTEETQAEVIVWVLMGIWPDGDE